MAFTPGPPPGQSTKADGTALLRRMPERAAAHTNALARRIGPELEDDGVTGQTLVRYG